MKAIRKAISLILVVALISGITITSFASGEGFSLSVYKADGSPLGASDSINVGDQITIRLNATELTINFAQLGVWFDSSVFSYNSASLSSEVQNIFVLKHSIGIPANYTGLNSEEKAKHDAGFEQVRIILSSNAVDVTASAGEWAVISLTAIAPAEASEMAILFNEVLYTVGDDPTVDLTGLSAGTATIKVNPLLVPAESITLNKTTLSLDIGGNETLIATVDPENSTDSVVWTSSDESVATVSSEGLVTAIAGGTATITATAGSASATCEVTVSPAGVIHVQSITICNGSDPVTELTLGTKKTGVFLKTVTLTAVVEPANADDSVVTWSSSNTAVATVNANGKITAVGAGTTVITASADGQEATCTVTVVVPVNKITLSATDTVVKAGHTLRLNATVEPVDADDPSLNWTSSNTDIATVDANGLVTAISAGDVTITAAARDGSNKNGAISITVVAVPEGDYTVSMAEDISGISVTEQVLIPVSIGCQDNTVTGYNAYRMLISYDPAALEFVSAASENSSEQFSASVANGVITVADCGEDKTLGTAFTLKFEAIGNGGATTVVVTEAQVDTGENAVELNAPEAGLVDPDTVINVNVTYTVTLPDDYTTEQSTTLSSGDDFTFAIAGYNPYYDYTVTATMGGESVDVTDNGDGTYTISNITGDVIIDALVSAPKSFSVTITPELEEVSGTATATYGTDYSFSIEEVSGFDYTVAITIGGVSYTTPEPTEGSYTIPGADITGAIVITITKTETPPVVETFSVTFDGAGATGAATATKGVDYTFIVAEPEDFAWKVEVTIGGAAYSEFTVNGNTYVIPGAAITGDIVIKTTMGNKIFRVTFTQMNPGVAPVTFTSSAGTGGGSSNASVVTDTVEQGENYVFRIMFKAYYLYEMTATMGGEPITPTPDHEYDITRNSENIEYTIENVTGDIEINLTRYMNLNVAISQYVQLDGTTVYLVTASEIRMGRTIYYNGNPLFKTPHYSGLVSGTTNNTFSMLIIVDDSFKQDEFIKAFKQGCLNVPSSGTYDPSEFITVSLTGDVNSSNYIDINDAQLAYDIYSGRYNSFDIVTMLKFLQADLNGDAKVDTLDAAAVIRKIA